MERLMHKAQEVNRWRKQIADKNVTKNVITPVCQYDCTI